MKHFKVTFLDSYTDDGLLAEIRRIASMHPNQPLTKTAFQRLSGRVATSTIQRRFGSWQGALEKAGVAHLYGGPVLTGKMRTQAAKQMTTGELIAELKRVHALAGGETLSTQAFNRHSTQTSCDAVRNRFGSWKEALEEAGIGLSIMGRRYTDQECFTNLANVWTHYGRVPRYLEMKQLPSVVGPKAYVSRWGTWRKALAAFVEWAEAEGDRTVNQQAPHETSADSIRRISVDAGEVRPGLRFKVLMRDKFRCVACGRSPATHLGVELHADHVISRADGGKTIIENLQTLCRECNLGKGRTSIK